MTNPDPREVVRVITRLGGWPSGGDPTKERARPDQRALFPIHALPRNRADNAVRRSRRLITSAHAEGMPIVFHLDAAHGEVSLRVGTCVFDSQSGRDTIDQRVEVLERLIRFAYPGAETGPRLSPTMERSEWSGIWVGVPRLGQVSRIVRALSGLKFSLLIIGQPLDAQSVNDLIDAAGEEQRKYHATIAESRLKEPAISLLESYLGRFVKRMQLAATIGGWRVGVYMMAEAKGAAACRASYRAAYGSAVPGIERLAMWDEPAAAGWAVQWALPRADVVHPLVPFPWQTVLSSNELANLTCLPTEEVPGFRLLDQPDFDVIPPSHREGEGKSGGVPRIAIGRVVSEGQKLELDYSIRAEELTKHCFIAGTTGSGKTNTIFHLLGQLAARKIPFLVIEPTKTEYRALVREPGFGGVRVYTLGNELGLPLRLNPLAPEPGTPVGQHIDLLKSVVGASIGAWNPLPQILEKALHRVFREAGWDVVTGANHRVSGEVVPASAYPTLHDLLEASVAVTKELGYSERVGPDIEAALRVRLESLLTGGKGKMLGATGHQSVQPLLSQQTVLELESIVDEEECAFVMGVLLIRIVEHLRASGNVNTCRLVVVIEEAHRLLGDTQRSNPEVEGNARFKAVSMFANLLAEVRAYGAGLIICDQSPSKLSGDVLKNTNTKIAHRIVSSDDAAALTMAMRLRKDQAGALASLNPGAAAVFSSGDDYPILVAVPPVKQDKPWPTNEDLKEAAGAPSIEKPERTEAVWIDRLLAAEGWDATLDRLLNVLIATPDHATIVWAEVSAIAARQFPGLADDERAGVLRRAVAVSLARGLRRRGRLYDWPYENLERLEDSLALVLDALEAGARTPAGCVFTTQCQELHWLSTGPLLSCSSSCGKGKGVFCVFRASAARLASSPDWLATWREADAAPDHERTKSLLNAASEVMIGIRDHRANEWSRRAAFCFAQHMIVREKSGHPTSMITTNNELVWKLIGPS